MKKQVKKLQLNKRTIQVLKDQQQQELHAGATTTNNSGGPCSFGTRCFICDGPYTSPVTIMRKP